MPVWLACNDPWEVITSTLEELHQITGTVVSPHRLNESSLHLLLSQRRLWTSAQHILHIYTTIAAAALSNFTMGAGVTISPLTKVRGTGG